MSVQLVAFELERKLILLDLGKTGSPTHTLQEMDGAVRDTYLNAIASKVDRAGSGTVRDFRGLQAELVSRCLFRGTKDSGLSPMTTADAQALPASVLQGIFNLAQELNGLSDAPADKGKAGPSGVPASGEDTPAGE